MDGRPPPAAAAAAAKGLLDAVAQWTKFITLAEARRLDSDKFATFARITFTKHPLPPPLLADLLLRPTASNRVALDPRVPLYLEVLLKQKYLNTTAVLRALYKYSTTHTRIQSDAERQDATAPAGTIKEEPGASVPKKQKITRWKTSYASEAVILWQLARYINQGAGIKSSRDVVEIAKIMARWISLFTDAAAAFTRDAFGTIHTQQQKNEVARSRDAFVLFTIAFSENATVLSTFNKPIAKAVRKHLSHSLEAFIPSVMHISPDFAGRLDMFRTQTLATFDPADKKDAAAVSDINSYMDNLMGLDSFQVSEIPIVNTRAGLYIYFSAGVGFCFSDLELPRELLTRYSSRAVRS